MNDRIRIEITPEFLQASRESGTPEEELKKFCEGQGQPEKYSPPVQKCACPWCNAPAEEGCMSPASRRAVCKAHDYRTIEAMLKTELKQFLSS
jgi:hypothetical protein